MKKLPLLLFLFICLIGISSSIFAADPPTLAIGSKAPNFNLKGTDNKMYSLASFAKAKVLVVLFTCNHCPTAQAYEDRIIKLTAKYKAQGVQVVGISPNADNAVRYDELGWSDLSDSFADMKIRVKNKKYNFPYLYDGTTQATTKLYGPVATPHVFVFDKNRLLQYTGRIDDDEHIGKETTHDLADAIEAVLAKKTIEKPNTKTFGCSIKWNNKNGGWRAEMAEWKNEPVSIKPANLDEIKEIVANKGTGNYRLINVWATWCGPCVQELPEFVKIKHMFTRRNFEMVLISNDEPSKEAAALKVLKSKWASTSNYIYSGTKKYDLIEAIDAKWQGSNPHTILVNPAGEIIYRKSGPVNMQELRKVIVDNLGHYFD
jgi:peroxiredoxin